MCLADYQVGILHFSNSQNLQSNVMYEMEVVERKYNVADSCIQVKYPYIGLKNSTTWVNLKLGFSLTLDFLDFDTKSLLFTANEFANISSQSTWVWIIDIGPEKAILAWQLNITPSLLTTLQWYVPMVTSWSYLMWIT